MTAPGPVPGMPEPGAPDVPPRPDSVKLAVELWFAVIVLEIIAAIAQYPVIYDQAQKAIDEVAKDGQEMPASATSLAVLGLVIACVVLSAIALTFMKFFWDGRNWARQGLGVFSAFLAVQLVFSVLIMFAGTESDTAVSAPAWASVFGILGGVAAIGALVALMNRDTGAYCRDMALWRNRDRWNGGMRR